MGPRPFAFSFGFVLVVWLSWKEAKKIYGFVKFTQRGVGFGFEYCRLVTCGGGRAVWSKGGSEPREPFDNQNDKSNLFLAWHFG